MHGCPTDGDQSVHAGGFDELFADGLVLPYQLRIAEPGGGNDFIFENTKVPSAAKFAVPRRAG